MKKESFKFALEICTLKNTLAICSKTLDGLNTDRTIKILMGGSTHKDFSSQIE